MYFFFFNDTATTEIYTLSLHDALPIWNSSAWSSDILFAGTRRTSTSEVDDRMLVRCFSRTALTSDRKSTRLNSSHANISYAVFCLKKKYSLNYSCVIHLSYSNVLRTIT